MRDQRWTEDADDRFLNQLQMIHLSCNEPGSKCGFCQRALHMTNKQTKKHRYKIEVKKLV